MVMVFWDGADTLIKEGNMKHGEEWDRWSTKQECMVMVHRRAIEWGWIGSYGKLGLLLVLIVSFNSDMTDGVVINIWRWLLYFCTISVAREEWEESMLVRQNKEKTRSWRVTCEISSRFLWLGGRIGSLLNQSSWLQSTNQRRLWHIELAIENIYFNFHSFCSTLKGRYDPVFPWRSIYKELRPHNKSFFFAWIAVEKPSHMTVSLIEVKWY